MWSGGRLGPGPRHLRWIAGHDRELPDLSADGFAERPPTRLRAHSSWDEKRLRFELHRYPGWPGQVPSYKPGERIWLQAREEAKARAGGALKLKDFHSKALSLGAMGLDPLREALSCC